MADEISLATLQSNPDGIGVSRPRVEDDAFLLGTGKFVDDINIEGQAYAAFVRSYVPHGRVVSVDAQSVLSIPGVIAVLTGADMEADNVGMMHSPSKLTDHDGTPIRNPEQRALTTVARFVGDSVAVVIADTLAFAETAASELVVEYDELPAVTDLGEAQRSDAPVIWESFGSNTALDWAGGDPKAVDEIFRTASHIAKCDVTNNRVVVSALEPRGVVAQYDVAKDQYTLWTPTQGGNQVREAVADPGLGCDVTQVRVITPDVGGGFGIKNAVHAEQIIIAWAARRVDRAVKWYGSRSDAFLSDFHARDHLMSAELAMDEQGHFLALRTNVVSNMGAYLSGAAPVITTVGGTRMLCNVYRIPTVSARTLCVYTNTAPVAAYRGAGKPEYAHLVEAVVDAAAEKMQLDRIEIRKRNLIQPDDMPWTTATGMVYDSGDFEARLDSALAKVAVQPVVSSSSSQNASRRTLHGRGVVMYTEPDGFLDNRAQMSFDPDGALTVISSAQTNGQGQFTTYTQMAASLLGIGANSITVLEGDTDLTGPGSGSGGSRSTTVTGVAMVECSVELIRKGRHLAAALLEAGVGDIEFADGRFTVVGTDRQVSWTDVARVAHDPDFDSGSDNESGLAADHHHKASTYCFPSGCHIADVQIDMDTGDVELTRYLSVSDIGVLVNPMMVEGQIHGGVAQGIGQVLFENTVYDSETGQLLSGSFMDYCLPRATQLPEFESFFESTPCLTNALGVKGVGESGTTAAIPAVSGAVMDALRGYDTSDLHMPFTSERIWQVLRNGALSSS